MMDNRDTLIITQKRAISRYQFVILGIVSGFVGIFLILLADLFANPPLWRSLGVAFFASGTIPLLVELCTRREFENIMADRIVKAIGGSPLAERVEDIRTLLSLTADLREAGVIQVVRTRHFNFESFIDEAEPSAAICLLGVCMKGFTSTEVQTLLRRKLEDKCTIRFLTLDATSKFVEQRAIEEGRKPNDIREDIQSVDNLHQTWLSHRVPEGLRPQIEYGHYDDAPSYFLVSNGKRLIIGFYLRGGRGEEFPHMEVENCPGGISSAFLTHFDKLWKSRKEAQLTSDPSIAE
jgi:hypothetical protein